MHFRDSRFPGLTEPWLSGEGINFGSHTYFFFWPHKDREPPRKMDQFNAGATSGTKKHERWYAPIHVNKVNIKDDYNGQMLFGKFVGLKLSVIRLTGEEIPRKNFTQETCPDRGSNPSPLRDRRPCYRLLHSGVLENI